MGTILSWLTTGAILGLIFRNSRSSFAGRSIFRLRHHESIRFIDGPLAGSTAQQRTDRNGLPAFQITPTVTRRDDLGGSYTLPYERGLLCDGCHCWHYTEGWTHENLALASIEEWGNAR